MPDVDITVVIPHIGPRAGALLDRAVASVEAQTLRPRDIVVREDRFGDGAPVTRATALCAVSTRWVAYLDDDDEMMPNHLELLAEAVTQTGADVAYPYCRVINADTGAVPWPVFGQPFDAELLRQREYIPIASLVRTDLAREARFYDTYYVRLLVCGSRFIHVPAVTWTWWHGDHNTGGQPGRWERV